MSRLLPSLLTLVLLCLAGCAENAEQAHALAFDRTYSQAFPIIGLVAVPEPSEDEIQLWPVGDTPGVLGQLKLASEGKVLRQAFAREHFDFAKAMAAALKERLTRDGYAVVDVARPGSSTSPLDFLPLDGYARIGAAADGTRPSAYLDLFPWRVGYAAGGSDGPDVRPYLAVAVRLVRVSGKDGPGVPLYSQLVAYGASEHPPREFMAAPARFRMPRFEDPKGQPGLLADGLRDAVDQVAQRIAADLRPDR